MSTKIKKLSPSDIVIFGGTGDLSRRKIIPALYYRLRDGQLPDNSRVFILGRQAMSDEEFTATSRKWAKEFIPAKDLNDIDWQRLAANMRYHQLDAKNAADYKSLGALLKDKPRKVRVFYLSTPADIFSLICTTLTECGLMTPDSRIVLEKPIGYDLESFTAINNAVLTCCREEQIYRIDHYLGKETVQNLMVLRFANNMFERMWNADAIDHVQITVAEEIGVGERYSYYDNAGALRDMVQNHLLQLLCLVAMEPPAAITPDSVRDEKLKVLRALRPVTDRSAKQDIVRGQYREAMRGGETLPSYLKDINVEKSDTETFIAIKVHVDNWRWAGIPFYIRTGKRLKDRYSEIVIQFKPVPHSLFAGQEEAPASNKLIIRLQPDEHVGLQVITKVPGPGGYRLKPVRLNLSLAEEFGERFPDAYERLLMDVVRGNLTLFMRSDEVEAAWIWTEQILTAWKNNKSKPDMYDAASWGPETAHSLLAHDGRTWHGGEE